ncbi:hypothetical protein V5799_031238 [Amblyomma americanum]|uniref:Uncharacterized protein n=1 Tax=Amblyomma americanum TaxID=6943 RepID=A0AAQ4ELF5_AMBAM
MRNRRPQQHGAHCAHESPRKVLRLVWRRLVPGGTISWDVGPARAYRTRCRLAGTFVRSGFLSPMVVVGHHWRSATVIRQGSVVAAVQTRADAYSYSGTGLEAGELTWGVQQNGAPRKTRDLTVLFSEKKAITEALTTTINWGFPH